MNNRTMVNTLGCHSNRACFSLGDELRKSGMRGVSRYEGEEYVKQAVMNEEDDVFIIHPRRCTSESCKKILYETENMQRYVFAFKNISLDINSNKWTALALAELDIFPIDAPFVINTLGDIQYEERFNSFFKDGQVVHPEFIEYFKPEVAAKYGWEYAGESDFIKTFMGDVDGKLFLGDVDEGSGILCKAKCHRAEYRENPRISLPDFRRFESTVKSPVFHLRGVPVEGVAAKVRGLDIYLITPSRNKKKINFSECDESKIAEVKQKCWLSFVQNETDHNAIETCLQDWKIIDPLLEKLKFFTEKLDCVLNKVSERSKEGDYSDYNRKKYSAEGTENIHSHSYRDGSFRVKGGSSSFTPSDEAPSPKMIRFGAPEGSFTSDVTVTVAVKKRVEALKNVKQFLDMILPDIEQLVLIDKRREYIQANLFLSDIIRLGANKENERLAVKPLSCINEKCVSMSISSPADIASVFCIVFQGTREISLLGDSRIELLEKATDIVFLISGLCSKTENRLNTMQSATYKEIALLK